jgi:glycosyltransferase involved in cell wall biosynthesis
MRRILVFAYFFPPSSEVAGKPTARLVKQLSLRGWEVVVVAPPVEAYEALDRLGHADIEKLVRVEQTSLWPQPIDFAIKIQRLPGRLLSWAFRFGSQRERCQASVPEPVAAGNRKNGAIARFVRDLLLFPDRRNWWIIPAFRKGRELLRQERFDAILSVSPSVSAHLACLLLRKRTRRAVWVAQFHDPWSDNPFHQHGALLSRIERWLERRVIENCDVIAPATDEAATRVRQRFSGRDVITIPNGFDPADFQPIDCSSRRDRRLTFVYTGALYGPRDPYPFLAALTHLIRRGDLSANDVRVRFIGDCEWAAGRPLRDVIVDLELQSVVEVSPPVSYPEALRSLAEADVLLLFAEGQETQIPAKLFEYFQVGRSILAFATGASARLIREGKAGKVVESSDAPGIQEAILDWASQTQNGGIRYEGDVSYFERYSAGNITEDFLAEIEPMIQSSERSEQSTHLTVAGQ